MSARVVLLGPPGSGKGTQGVGLGESLGVPTISTGAIFRDNLSRQTPLGQEAGGYMSAGQLVPDSVTNAMVRDRLAEPDAAAGFILDGYPRNLAQVAELDDILGGLEAQIDLAVELVIPAELIVARLLKRAEIEGRADDTEPVIRQRIEVYDAQTAPIAAVYAERGVHVKVDGVGTVDDVAARLRQAVAAGLG